MKPENSTIRQAIEMQGGARPEYMSGMIRYGSEGDQGWMVPA